MTNRVQVSLEIIREVPKSRLLLSVSLLFLIVIWGTVSSALEFTDGSSTSSVEAMDLVSSGTLKPGWYAYSSRVFYNNSQNLSLTFKVTSGPPVDLFFMDEKGFKQYNTSKVFCYYNVSRLNVSYTHLVFSPPRKGRYYTVIDNTKRGLAKPHGKNVSYEKQIHKDTTVGGPINDVEQTFGGINLKWILGGAITIVVVVRAVAIYFLKVRRHS